MKAAGVSLLACVLVAASAAAEEASPPPDLGSLNRCGCNLASATFIHQPDHCRLKAFPDLVGTEGFLKAFNDKSRPPWRVAELKQTAPDAWDVYIGKRRAKTKVRVLEFHPDQQTPTFESRLLVTEFGTRAPQPFSIKLRDFDPVPWWQCSPDKAVVHSRIVARPQKDSRPVTVEGKSITRSRPKTVWCWAWNESVGMYCTPKPEANRDDWWIYKPSELEIVY